MELARPIRFRDATTQAEFDRQGFVRVPFLGPEAVAELQSLWDEVAATNVCGIYSNVHDLDVDVNRRVDATITRLLTKPADALFADGRLGGASFLVKGTGRESDSKPHQDWNNVDETYAQSLSIWCPLIDVDERNGALQVIPGSHRLRASIRSIDTPSLYLDFTEELEGVLECVPAQAGEAVLYAHNLFHGSKPNSSDRIRVSVVSGVLPRDVPNIHYRQPAGNPPGTFEVLQVSRDFFLEGLPEITAGRLPTSAVPVGRVHLADHQLRVEDIADLMSSVPRVTSELPKTRSPTRRPIPPRYVDALLEDFGSGLIGRNNHLGHWDDPAGGFEQATFAEAKERMNELIAELAGVEDGDQVLDVGCGFGGFPAFVDRHFAEVSITGLDVDERQLAMCRSIQPRPGNRISWIRGDGCVLPLRSRAFDRAICIEAMWHFASRSEFFSEVVRALRPHGTLACVDILVDRQAAASLGLSTEGLAELLDVGFGPWPDTNATIDDVLATAESVGLRKMMHVDATANTQPSYNNHGDSDLRPGASRFSANTGVAYFVELHRRGLIGVHYLAFERAG